MPRSVSPIATAHKNQLDSEFPFIWLFELQTNDDPPQRYRLTNFTRQVAWGEDSSGSAIIYYPAPVTHSGIEQGSDGDLPTISVTVPTGGLFEIAIAVEKHNGFVGNSGRIVIISSIDIENPVAVMDQPTTVTDCSMDSKAITLRMSAYNVYRLQAPPFLYAKRNCRWIFGSAECGYNLNASGAAYSSCERTLAACTLRGDDEDANVNVGTRQHPDRFGGFPGVPRPRRR